MSTASPLAHRLSGGGSLPKAAPVLRQGSGGSAPASAGPTDPPMTAKQRAFIDALLADREGVVAAEQIRARLNVARDDLGISRAHASKAIDALKKIPKAEAVEVPIEKTVASLVALRRNRYSQACNACGKKVAEEAGFLDKSDEGKWVVTHEICPTGFPFPEGRYAIDNEEGDLRFYHLVDGEIFVMASDNEYPVTKPESITYIVETIALDPLEASKRYGVEFQTCGVCGRGLTNQESRDLGIGPVCLSKAFS